MNFKVGDIVELPSLNLGVVLNKGVKYSTVGRFIGDELDLIETDIVNNNITVSELGYINHEHQEKLDELSEQIITLEKLKHI